MFNKVSCLMRKPADFFVHYFETVIVRDEDELAAAHKLRYQVYCVENSFEDPADNPDQLERDLYDSRATHCLLFHRPSGTVAGTVRLVLPNRQQLDQSFPLQEICQDSLIRDPAAFPVARMAEISRFCIAKEFRRSEGSHHYENLGDFPILCLIEGAVRMSIESGIDYWCAVMEPPLLRYLSSFGIHFVNIGTRVDYHGKRQPCYQRLDRFLERVRAERPDVWEILTDDGRHWQALQQQLAAAS